MTLKRMTPVFLAASVAVSGFAGLLMGAVSPAHAITSVDELSDVNRNHWAFDALRDLVEKYDVIEGYPSGVFLGNRQPTRWEMAAALNSLVKSIGRDLARLGAEKADKRDLQTVARLQEEFRNELNALNARTKALEDRASAIEAKNAEQDGRLSLLEKTQIHGDMSLGFLSDHSSHGPGNNANADGISDGISAIGRLRLALDIPVKEETEDSKIGRGDVYARLVAAFGRNGPTNNSGGLFSGYSRIAADADQSNDGILTSGSQNNTSGINNRSNVYLEAAYYKQNFKSGIPVLTDWFGVWPDKENWETTGDMYVGLVPWRFLFDKSPYRGNELSQFQNTSLVNTPGMGVNLNQPTVAYAWHQGLGENANLDFTTALSTFNASDAYDGLNLTYEARLNYLMDWWSDDAVEGSLYAGGYHAWMGGNSVAPGGLGAVAVDRAGAATLDPTRGQRLDAFYGGWNQEWYKGIGTFVSGMLQSSANVGYGLASANQINGINNAFNAVGTVASPRWSGATGVNVPMSAFGDWRPDDVFGVGYSLVNFHKPNTENGLDSSMEQVVEAYYKYQFTDSISIVPSTQFIFNRLGLGANDFTAVVGLRTNFLF